MVAWLNRPFPNQLVFYGTDGGAVRLHQGVVPGRHHPEPAGRLLPGLEIYRTSVASKEQRWAIPLFLLAALLFALGLVFCNLVILPWSSISS